jgi:hypothetical protein
VGHEVEELAHAKLRVVRRVLREVADRAATAEGVAPGIAPVDAHGARRRREDAGEDAHGRRLAGPVRPEEADDLATPDGEADAGEGGDGAEGLLELPHLDHRRRRHGGHG